MTSWSGWKNRILAFLSIFAAFSACEDPFAELDGTQGTEKPENPENPDGPQTPDTPDKPEDPEPDKPVVNPDENFVPDAASGLSVTQTPVHENGPKRGREAQIKAPVHENA